MLQTEQLDHVHTLQVDAGERPAKTEGEPRAVGGRALLFSSINALFHTGRSNKVVLRLMHEGLTVTHIGRIRAADDVY